MIKLKKLCYMFKILPIKIYALHVTNKKLKYSYVVYFLSIKRARKYFDSLNRDNDFEVSLDIGCIQL